MKQVKQVVMLPTKNEVHKGIWKGINNKLFYNAGITSAQRPNIPFNIYFTDNSEIKEDDWMVSRGGTIIKAGNSTLVNMKANDGSKCLKIVSSTDKELMPNSWIPDSFVNKYIEMYNAGTPITEVNVEYFSIVEHIKYGDLFAEIESIKTREDGSIIISAAKTYTSDEVINKMRILAFSLGAKKEYFDKWIEENL